MLAESDELVTDRWTLPTTPVTRTEPPEGGGGHLGIFWVGMCRPVLQIGTPF